MKQITPEIKARVFALYWGQPIINAEGLTKLKRMDELNPLRSGDYLEVKSLSSITDEDAIEVSNICKSKYTGEMDERVENIKKWARMYARGSLEISDYLRSKGYALPYMDWSVDELVAEGVFKMKEVDND